MNTVERNYFSKIVLDVHMTQQSVAPVRTAGSIAACAAACEVWWYLTQHVFYTKIFVGKKLLEQLL